MPGTIAWLKEQPEGTVQAALTEWRFGSKCNYQDCCNDYYPDSNYPTTYIQEVEDE